MMRVMNNLLAVLCKGRQPALGRMSVMRMMKVLFAVLCKGRQPALGRMSVMRMSVEEDVLLTRRAKRSL
jgi:hypothetical protein